MHADRSGPLGPADFGVDCFTASAVLDGRAEQCPDRTMMVIAGVEVTFEQMQQRSSAAAKVLADLGIGRGDCVALFSGACPEWVYFWLGAARIGAVSAAVNAAQQGDFLLHTLRLSRAKVVFTVAERPLRRPHAVLLCTSVRRGFVETLDELPKNVIGRIRKALLRSAAWVRPRGTANDTDTSLPAKLRQCYVGEVKLSYCYAQFARPLTRRPSFERLKSTNDQLELSGRTDARRRNGPSRNPESERPA